jgi:hypothetical protein
MAANLIFLVVAEQFLVCSTQSASNIVNQNKTYDKRRVDCL